MTNKQLPNSHHMFTLLRERIIPLVALSALTAVISGQGTIAIANHQRNPELAVRGANVLAVGITGLSGVAVSTWALAIADDRLIRKLNREYQEAIARADAQRILEMSESAKRQAARKNPECPQCKYFSNNIYLPCAVHPNLKVNCQDYDPKQ